MALAAKRTIPLNVVDGDPRSPNETMPKILVVEDDQNDREIILWHLTKIVGLESDIQIAGSYNDADHRLAECIFDAVIVDQLLWGQQGLSLVSKYAKTHFQTHYVMLTGVISTKLEFEALKAGASAFIPKAELSEESLGRCLRYGLKAHEESSRLHDQAETLRAAYSSAREMAERNLHMAQDLNNDRMQLQGSLNASQSREKNYRNLAERDQLTGLPNRRRFNRELERALASTERSGSSLAVMVLNIDQFKDINTNFGHDIGDKMLQALSERVQGVLRESDILSHFSADEFGVIATNINGAVDAGSAAARILECIKAPFNVSGCELSINMSIGIAEYKTGSRESGNELIRKANLALFRIKKGNRGSYAFFDAGLSTQVRRTAQLGTDLRRNINSAQFTMHYLPVMNASGDLLDSLEALVRWRHPKLGLIEPLELIPIAESCGLISDLVSTVLRELAQDQLRLKRFGVNPPPISINISANHFTHDRLFANLMKVLEDVAIKPREVELQIASNCTGDRLDRMAEQIRKIRDRGIRISIDNFGSGSATFEHIEKLPVDRIKIAETIVSRAPTHAIENGIVQSMLALARSTGFQVVLKGIETAEQAKYARDLGSVLAQGFYYSRPLHCGELPAWLRDHSIR